MVGSSVGVKSSDVFGTFSSSPACGSTLQESNPLNPLHNLIFVRYRDHVLYNRSSALMMQPQNREAVGWLIYDCELYVILSWDRDAGPPTLHGGDPKASGLVLLKSDIIALERLKVKAQISLETVDRVLNSPQPIVKDELAFRPSERKTHSTKRRGQ